MEQLREDDPEQIGPYRLFALLGRGGWGNVYFARPEYGRAVALKTIRPDRLEEAPERFRSRFTREVAAARAVGSAYTAEVVDADTRAPEPWFAARYIPGVDLATALDLHRGPLPHKTWRVLAAGLADALHGIHTAGLVHRDLKLGNILLATTGPAVIDFGIARHLSPAAGTALTLTGFVPRTLTFASPEQLREERVGPECDVFALGLVLAYVSLARHPFGPGSPMQISAAILQGGPRLDGMPAAVAKVVRPCLEPQPRNRPRLDEISALLRADRTPQADEWLPPLLRAAVDERSGIALDLAEPMRPGRAAPGPSSSSRPSPTRSTPPAAASPTTAQGARARQEHDLTAATAGSARHDATTLPPAGPAAAVKKRGAAAPDGSGTGSALPKTALRFLTEAQQGNPKSMRRVAAAYQRAGDPTAALQWYRRSASQGSLAGAYGAARTIEEHFPQQHQQVLPLYRQAAKGDMPEAWMRLGELLEQQPGGLAEALKWFEKAAARKQPDAAEAVVRVREALGRTAVPSAESAVLHKHQAAAMEGQITSILTLGAWYHKEKRPQDALVWYRRAADAGHAHGMLLTAQLLAKDPKRQEESLAWYRRSAAAGNAQALYWLGGHLRDKGQPAVAALEFRKAAEQQHVASMIELAKLLERTKQEDQALEWYRRAAPNSDLAAEEAERILAARAHRAAPPPKAAPLTATSTTPKGTAQKTAAAKTTTATAPTATPAAAAAKKTTKKAKRSVEDSAAAARHEAEVHERRNRLEDAVRCYRQAEQLGDQAAKWDTARLCLRLAGQTSGAEERRRLRKQAFRRYRELAGAGDTKAVQALIDNGAHDADAWLLRSAEAGNVKAMREAARARLAAGGDDDVRTALVWLHRAGQAGSTAAAMEGARVHEQRGAYRDALDWYRWAGANGHPDAARHVARLEAAHPGIAFLRRVSDRLRRPWGRPGE